MGQREAHLNKARKGSFDVVVIGGGITGAGVARDAVRRGLRVLLLDKADLAWGTSSRSSKLVHGGLRYLEHGQISLVFESVSERRVLMDIAPHLVQPLGFVFPIFKGRSSLVIDIGMWIYDGLSLFRSPRIHRRLSREDIAQEEPLLTQDGLKSAALYYDCATDDARLTLETALDASRNGGTLVTWCEVTGFQNDRSRRVVGVDCKDVLGGEEFSVKAGVVVNATGPWTDGLRRRALGPGMNRLLRPTKGVHIVVDHQALPLKHAVVLFHPDDDRVMFAIPWGERSYVGTTDTDWSGDPDHVVADAADVDYLLRAANHYFPQSPISAEHVLSTWAGLRPLISQEGVDESSVSREHHVIVEPNGMVTVAGGKLTTYRRMAAEVVDRAVDVLRMSGRSVDRLRSASTDQEPLPGAVGWPEDDDLDQVTAQILKASNQRLNSTTAAMLAGTYGMLAMDIAVMAGQRPGLAEFLIPGRPEVLAQVEWAVSRELAATVEDFMVRRTPLYFKDRDQGLGALEQVAGHMGAMLGWSDERIRSEKDSYRALVAGSREWRNGQRST